MSFDVFGWMRPAKECPQQHYHLGDPTCGTGRAPAGAQTGPHYHVGSDTCHAGQSSDPQACNVPHWHQNDPTWRQQGSCGSCG